MRKLLVALLCAIMLLTCVGAMAEENEFQTFGQFVCHIWDGDRVSISDYALEDGQTELFIPRKIDGKKVEGFDIAQLPESVKTIYYPENCGWDGRCADGRELLMIQYVDYDWVSNDEWYSKYLADMGEDDYALLWTRLMTWKDGESRDKAIDLYAEQLPTELDGHKVHIQMANDQDVIYTSGEWQYKLDTYDNDFRVEIVGTSIPEGTTETVIPDVLDGYIVHRVWLNAIPESVELVYMDEDAYFDYSDITRTIKVIKFEGYEDVQKNEYQRERVPEMTENDLALLDAMQYSYSANGSDTTWVNVYADKLPAELLGKKCLNAISENYVLYTSGKWTYSYYNDGVKIVDVEPEAGQTTLYIPSVIEGRSVQSVDAAIAGKHGITLFIAPRNSWFQNYEEVAFGSLQYIDRAWVDARQDDYYTEQYAWLGEKDLSVEDYTYYANGESTKDTIEYKDIPTEVEGFKVTVKMSFDDNVTQYKKDDYSYILLPDDTIAITKYENEMAKSLIIPARIDGKTVTALMASGYDYVINNSDLTSLELPSTLKVIGDRAIYAWSLKKLEIPDGVTEIGKEAIQCYKLSSINLPEGLTKLGTKWLYSGSMKSISFPSTLTTLADNAFSNASRLDSVKLPDTVTNVGTAAFAEMYRLSKLTLPETMTVIPERLAAACERLAKITIPAATETIGKQAFAGCTKLATVTFAKKDAQIKVIGDGAFAGSGLGKIALPEGLTTIGKEAFQGCEKLSSVTMYDNITSIDTYAFSGCTKLTKISLSESLTTIKEGTFMGCKKLASVTIPESVTAIEDFAFEGCASKLTLTVKEGSFAHQWAEENGYKVKLAK